MRPATSSASSAGRPEARPRCACAAAVLGFPPPALAFLGSQWRRAVRPGRAWLGCCCMRWLPTPDHLIGLSVGERPYDALSRAFRGTAPLGVMRLRRLLR